MIHRILWVSETASVCRGQNYKPNVFINFYAKYIDLMSHWYFAYTCSVKLCICQHLFRSSAFFNSLSLFFFLSSCKIGSFSKTKFALRQEYNYFSWSVFHYKLFTGRVVRKMVKCDKIQKYFDFTKKPLENLGHWHCNDKPASSCTTPDHQKGWFRNGRPCSGHLRYWEK